MKSAYVRQEIANMHETTFGYTKLDAKSQEMFRANKHCFGRYFKHL